MSSSDQQQKLIFYKALTDISNQIHAAKNLDEILINLEQSILTLFEAERLTIYAVDDQTQEAFSRFFSKGDTGLPSEIRVPINNRSLAGFVAKNGQPVNVADAYDKEALRMINRELVFDQTWDETTGFKTKQVLVVPIIQGNQVVGVIQLINKLNGEQFTVDDQNSVIEVALVLGVAISNQWKLSRTGQKKGRLDYLVDHNIITKNQLDEAINKARSHRVDAELILMGDLNVTKDDIGKALNDYFECDFVAYDDQHPVPVNLLERKGKFYLQSSNWVPLSVNEEGVVKILIDNPKRSDRDALVGNMLSNKLFEYVVGVKEDIQSFINLFYQDPLILQESLVESLEMTDAEKLEETLSKLELDFSLDEEEESEGGDEDQADEEQSEVIQLVNKIVMDAYAQGCSDIHLEPYPRKEGLVARFRVDGICRTYLRIPTKFKQAVIARIKIMADLDISERRKPQDGKIAFRKYGPLDIELRVATVPTVGGQEDVVMRILAAGEPLPLDVIGFSDRDHNALEEVVAKPYGLILVVGPTGSGKTTTLHAILKTINTEDRKIWTAEDPVEITQSGLRQVQVLPIIGFTFAAAMRSFLRADPDVIMVGEMRDEETASTGIEASLTGHLVFSTLHTNSAPETITRLLEMGLDPFNFADAIRGIVAQRLVRTLCAECKESDHPDEDEYTLLAHNYGAGFDESGFAYTDDLALYRAKGCDKCSQTGYRGRVGLFELLEGTEKMKHLIQTKADIDTLRIQAREDGMNTLMQDGIRRIFDGVVDLQNVRRVCIA
jgi:type II secretory ATPase GspE/PulE/Tfp pilus assembly ATPase PilB-like protein